MRKLLCLLALCGSAFAQQANLRLTVFVVPVAQAPAPAPAPTAVQFPLPSQVETTSTRSLQSDGSEIVVTTIVLK